MTKEEYIKETNILEYKIEELNSKLVQMKQDYISDHKQLCIEDKVTIKQYENGECVYSHDVFVIGFVEENGIIIPKFNDSKKDGKESSKRFYLYNLDRNAMTDFECNGKTIHLGKICDLDSFCLYI